MELLTVYTEGTRIAKVFKMSENIYLTECWYDNKILNKNMYSQLEDAKTYANAFTNVSNPQQLNG